MNVTPMFKSKKPGLLTVTVPEWVPVPSVAGEALTVRVPLPVPLVGVKDSQGVWEVAVQVPPAGVTTCTVPVPAVPGVAVTVKEAGVTTKVGARTVRVTGIICDTPACTGLLP